MNRERILTVALSVMITASVMMLAVLIPMMFLGDFYSTFTSVDDHIYSAFVADKRESTDFIEDRTFLPNTSFLTSFDRGVIDRSDSKMFDVCIESFVVPDIYGTSADVLGPFGFLVTFKDLANATAYGFDGGSIAMLPHQWDDEKNVSRGFYCTESYIYLIDTAKDGVHKVKAQLSGDMWNDLADKDGRVAVKCSDGTLMSLTGKYQLYLLMKEYTFEEKDGKYTVIGETYRIYTYTVTANSGFRGVLQKNGLQSDYRFQFSLCERDDLIMPRSEKICIEPGETLNFSIEYSDRYDLSNACFDIYKVDGSTGEHTLCYTTAVDIGMGSSGVRARLVFASWENMESGIYKFVLRGDFRNRINSLRSFDELFNCFSFETAVEEYEYYVQIGDL